MKNRILAILISLISLFSLISCSNDSEPSLPEELTQKFEVLSIESSYKDLYEYYLELTEYEELNEESYEIKYMKKSLYEMMLYGRWEADKKYFYCYEVYSDYYNTKSTTWLFYKYGKQ